MSATFWADQQALYAAMVAASVVGGRIYDHVPDAPTYPYVAIGGGQSLPVSVTTAAAVTDRGTEHYFDLHVWSRYRGAKEAAEIMAALHDLFDGGKLAVSGRTSANAFVDAMRGPWLDDDGLTRHGVVTVKVISRD